MLMYAGIGSRKTPAGILKEMEWIGKELANKDWRLRSGNAKGADRSFQKGANLISPELVELFLPWASYEREAIEKGNVIHTRPSKEAYQIAAKYHPAWFRCGQGARAMHARNVEIILGRSLSEPVDFLICWTPGGKLKGGTAQGIRVAIGYNVPVINLGSPDGLKLADEIVKYS